MTTETTLDHKRLTFPERLADKSKLLAGGGGVLIAIAAVLGVIGSFVDAVQVDMSWFFHAYLTGLMFCVSISIGALFFVIMHHLSRAGWSTAVRRLAELLAMVFPALGVLFVGVLLSLWFGDNVVYRWDGDASIVGLLHESKQFYLSSRFFTFRAILYFALWSGTAYYFYRLSREQDETGDAALTGRMQKFSGPATFVFALTTSFAAFDWMMSLAPTWFSTIFGVYLFASSMLAFFAAMCVFLTLLDSQKLLSGVVTIEHWHDIGKYMFGFIVFWTYIAFSQYMLIWYGNIPEETEWFHVRQEHGWAWVSILLVVGHWLIPFLGTMSRHVRRNKSAMLFWGIYLLVMHYIDLYWVIMPQHDQGVFGGFFGLLVSVLCWAGMIGLYAGAILYVAGHKTPLVAVRDPRLGEAMAFHQV